MEKWKPCHCNRHYEVSDKGRVRSLTRTIEHNDRVRGKVKRIFKGRMLKPGQRASGHVNVSINGRSWDVHQLVLRAFVRSPLSGEMCRHLNGVPHDNRLENLTWGTQGENMQDRKHHGAPTKLSVAQVAMVKRLLIDNVLSCREIARIYCVSKTTVQNINHNRVHKDVRPAPELD